MNGSGNDQRGGGHRAMRAMLLVVWLAACTVVSAQTTRQSAVGLYENQAIRTNDAARSATTRGAVRADASRPASFVDLSRIALALGIVLAIIFVLRWIGRRYFPAVSGVKGAGAVRVLSRSPVAPRQQVLLVQVGRRVLVVADNGTQMSALSEITDPDEIAHLVGQVSGANSPGVFDAAFGKARLSYADDVPPDAPQPAAVAETDETGDESVAAAHGEIKGLMDKVRGLAKQLGNP